MIVFFAADHFGQISVLCDSLRQKAQKLDRAPDWVFHVGSFGAFPDPKHTNTAMRRAGIKTDFHEYYLGTKTLPYPILFAPGRHEDHRWLESMYQKGYFELMPNLHRMPSGFARTLEVRDVRLTVLTLGGVFSPVIYGGGKKRKRTWCHYTKRDVEKACTAGPIDLLLTAEAGYGTALWAVDDEGHHQQVVSKAAGINNISFATQPKLHVHGHYNMPARSWSPVTKTSYHSLAYGEVRAYEWNGVKWTMLH